MDAKIDIARRGSSMKKELKLVLVVLGLGLLWCLRAGDWGNLGDAYAQTQKLIQKRPLKTDDLTVQTKLDSSVTEIVLKIDGSADIEFHPSVDVFSASNIRFEHSDKNPVSIRVENGRAILRQKGRRVHAQYDVFIPNNRSVRISVGAANFNGNIEEKSLKFVAGALNLKARLTVTNTLEFMCGSANLNAEVFKAKKLKLFCGSAGGKLVVPSGTNLPWVPFWFGLRIVAR